MFGQSFKQELEEKSTVHPQTLKATAKEMVNSENTPLKEGRRKVGYMELMHKSFLEEFPDLNYLTPQNLRDKISHVEKINKSKTSLIEAFNSIDNTNIEARGEIRNNAHININNKINYACCPLNKKELEVFNEAKDLFYIICKDIGNMKNRKWTTIMNKVPEQSDIFSVRTKKPWSRNQVIKYSLRGFPNKSLAELFLVLFLSINEAIEIFRETLFRKHILSPAAGISCWCFTNKR